MQKKKKTKMLIDYLVEALEELQNPSAADPVVAVKSFIGRLPNILFVEDEILPSDVLIKGILPTPDGEVEFEFKQIADDFVAVVKKGGEIITKPWFDIIDWFSNLFVGDRMMMVGIERKKEPISYFSH